MRSAALLLPCRFTRSTRLAERLVLAVNLYLPISEPFITNKSERAMLVLIRYIIDSYFRTRICSSPFELFENALKATEEGFNYLVPKPVLHFKAERQLFSEL